MDSDPKFHFTYAEWLALVNGTSTQSQPEGDDWHSVTELSDIMGVKVSTVREGLRKAQKDGRLDAQVADRLSIDGRMRPVPIYKVRK